MNESTISVDIVVNDNGSTKIRDFGRNIETVGTQSDNATGKVKNLGSSFGALGVCATAAISALGVAYLVEFAKEAFNAGVQIDSLRRSFAALAGGAIGAGEELSFLRETAAKTGQDFYSLTDSYRMLMAATRDTTMEGKKTQDLFASMSEAAAVLGMSSDTLSLSFKAFADIASKGTAQADDLKKQLGNSLPGAMNIAASAMGVTTQQLQVMMKNGEVMADDLLPKMAAKLHEMYGEAAKTASLESGASAVNKLSQAYHDLLATIGDSDTAFAIVRYLGTELEVFTNSIKGLQAVGDNKLSFFSYATMDAKEMATWLEINGKGLGDLKKKLNDEIDIRDRLAQDTRFSSSEEIAAVGKEIQAHNAKIAILKEEITAYSASGDAPGRAAQKEQERNLKAYKSHADQEHQYYTQLEKDKQKAIIDAYDNAPKAAQEALANQMAAQKEVAAAQKDINQMMTDAMPSGLGKELAQYDQKYIDSVEKLKGYQLSGIAVSQEYYDALSGAHDKGRADIAAQFIEKYTESVAGLSTSLDALTSKDKTLSTVDKEMESITTGFDKWDNSAQKVVTQLSGETDPAVVSLRENLQKTIATSAELEFQEKKTFQAKTIEDFEKSLKALNDTYSNENLSDYESEMQKINKDYDDQIEKAKQLWGESDQYHIELQKIETDRQKAIANDIKLAKSGENLWAGFVAGAKEAEKSLTTLGGLGYQIFGDLESAMSGSFVDVMHGQFDQIGGLWDDMLSKMGDDIAKYLADKLTHKVMDSLLTGADSLLGGTLSSIFGDLSGIGGATYTNGAMNVNVTNWEGSFGGSTGSNGLLGSLASLLSSNGSINSSAIGDANYGAYSANFFSDGSSNPEYSSSNYNLSGNYVDSSPAYNASNYTVADDGTYAANQGMYSSVGTTALGAAKDKIAPSAAGTTLGTLGGYVGVIGGAYGMYNGISNMVNGHPVQGAVQTGLGAYSAYNGAVAAGLVHEGAATGAYNATVSYLSSLGSETAATGTATGTAAGTTGATEAATTGTAAAAGGSSATATGAFGLSAGSTVGVMGAIFAAGMMINANRHNDNQHIQASLNESGLSPDDMKQYSDTVLDLNKTVLAGIPDVNEFSQVLYKANDKTILLTGSTGEATAKFNEATHSWDTNLTNLYNGMGQASLSIVNSTQAMISGYTGTTVAISDATAVANQAALAANDLKMGYDSATNETRDLQAMLIGLGYSSKDAASAAGDLISSINGSADATSGMADAVDSVGTSSTAATAPIFDLSNHLGNMVGDMSTLNSVIAGLGGTVAGTAADISGAIHSLGGSASYFSSAIHAGSTDGSQLSSDSSTGEDTGRVFKHALGGVFPSYTRIGSHVFGEAGPEALLPLPDGPDTLSKIIDRLDALTANAARSGSSDSAPQIHVYIGNEQLDARVFQVAKSAAFQSTERADTLVARRF